MNSTLHLPHMSINSEFDISRRTSTCGGNHRKLRAAHKAKKGKTHNDENLHEKLHFTFPAVENMFMN